MNKTEFMKVLSDKLHGLPKDDYDDAINYYTEFFMDGDIDDDTDVIPIVGTPENIARKILDDALVSQIKSEKAESNINTDQGKERENNSSLSKTIWLIILSIFAAPIAFPVAIAAVAVVFSLAIACFAVLFSIVIASFAVIVSGVLIIPGIFFAGQFAQGLVILGIALIALSLGIVLFYGALKLCRVVFSGIGNYCHKKFKKSELKEVE
ncbi:MAG: DUF1700 domain-containing protein [Eubacterium sp.]|nr:DUF1700 domain-containing protein [Eubacterium sp.]